MRLYHGTKLENVDSIKESGLEPMLSEKVSNDERLNQSAVYGFDNMQDAIDFMVYDNNQSEWAVFEFDGDGAILDSEYDGNAWAVITEENVKATLIKTAEC